MSGKWYIAGTLDAGEQVPVQIDARLRKREGGLTLPKDLVAIAGREYEKQGYSQTFERLCERGGLSILEIIQLMADAVNRLEAAREAQGGGKPDAQGGKP